ncbi:hypothetical protein BpHYR1_025989 [Brachionus plicatilis]|uniref:Uncharacterized protein n=1 Tax=Brachionus plicatilis TaxID=10195 RepID=A0A3M7Q2L9_BRAPC|nr:hypothetical protein BpHYR1_025989 [Brachionus plicatilis]
MSIRFPIDIWNLHERVKKDLPRTSNNVESWHSRIKSDARHNLTVNKVVEFFRLEQSSQLKSTSSKAQKKEDKIKRQVNEYKTENLELFLTGFSILLMEY